jgi:hypothetical protein
MSENLPDLLREIAGTYGSDDGENHVLTKAAAEIERLRAAGDAAFMAMCAYRDSPDKEVFQDAIDALGMALSERV